MAEDADLYADLYSLPGVVAAVGARLEPAGSLSWQGHKVKQHLGNATPATVEELRSQVDRGLASLRQRPDLLPGFFHPAGLPDVTLFT